VLVWTRELVQFVGEMAAEYSRKAGEQSNSIKFVTGNIEPFGQQAYAFSRGSAWRHDIAAAYNTFNGVFLWSDPEDDEIARKLTEEYHTAIQEKAVELSVSKRQGGPDMFYPPNYSMGITTSSAIYGPNMPRLQEIRKRVDPDNLVSLTGGFKI
jgi:Berberine and berberine like